MKGQELLSKRSGEKLNLAIVNKKEFLSLSLFNFQSKTKFIYSNHPVFRK